MGKKQIHAVTGAYGYTGKYIARKLLENGYPVRTLTSSVHRENPFGGRVEAVRFEFEDETLLAGSLEGVAVLYNTYWVRFNHRLFTHADAVRNTIKLFRAAEKAGVEHVVHLSITNPSEDSPFEYFRGKAILEKALSGLAVSSTILRPAVIFGEEDILINNIAWMIRHLPVLGVFGDGEYRLQPVFVDDLADLAVRSAINREVGVIDAVGPETFTYRGLIEKLAEIMGVNRRIVSVSPTLGFVAAKIIGWLVRDVILTREEIGALMTDLLHTKSPPAGQTKLTDWAADHRHSLGRHYASELRRRVNRSIAY
ncbi:MAG: NAD(P)H-binding protein [Candidatus Zixiibacteriota bacterium]|nr:MAG: NAD(P)H-binding protein [candidate division Zixibacteria bacterium]